MSKGNLGFCKSCGEEGDFYDDICDECFKEIEKERRDYEAEKQYIADRY